MTVGSGFFWLVGFRSEAVGVAIVVYFFTPRKRKITEEFKEKIFKAIKKTIANFDAGLTYIIHVVPFNITIYNKSI